MCLIYINTSATGHIVISDVPGIIVCFGSLKIIHSHPGDPAKADQTPARAQMAYKPTHFHGRPLLSHCHLQAVSAVLVVLLMALLFCCPTMPKHPSALARNQSAKPLQLTSTGQPCVLGEFPLKGFPRDCQLQHHNLLGDNVRMEGGDCFSVSQGPLAAASLLLRSGCTLVLSLLGKPALLHSQRPWCSRGRPNCFAHTSPVLIASAMVFRIWSCLHR